MTDSEEPFLHEALDALVREEVYIPVRSMEAVLARGDAAFGPVLERFEAELEQRDSGGNPLWLGVLLGLLRRPEAVAALCAAVRRAGREDLALGMVATEALSRIGAAAIPALRALLAELTGPERAWAYAALGGIRSDEAYALLLEALTEDPARTDVVANALADQGRPDAIPPLYESLLRAAPGQRVEIEDAIRSLHGGDEPHGRLAQDWRLRYRRDPSLRFLPLSWPAVEMIAGVVKDRRAAPTSPVRPLEEILAEGAEAAGPSVDGCPDCGGAYFDGTGVKVCPCTAAEASAFQARYLELMAAEAGVEDVFAALDLVDRDLEEALHRPEPKGRRAREALETEIESLNMARRGCVWLIEAGIEDVGRGVRALAREARKAALVHGHGDALSEEEPAAPREEPRVGRNDPCPCGSGRKYKRCCGKADPARAVGPTADGRRPVLVNFDGELVSFCRSHYAVKDRQAVVAALNGSPDLDPQKDGGSYAWIKTVAPGEIRPLGTLRLEEGGLVLECLSEERLRGGRALIEELAGAWLTHRGDTTQDPWRAVEERERRGGVAPAPAKRLPPEQEAELLRAVYDRLYRSWPDEPLPALGGRTAREAVRTEEGREDVADLLASMELLEARKPPSRRYDFGWIWNELGIADLR